MEVKSSFFRSQAKRSVALLIVVSLFIILRYQMDTGAEVQAAAQRFKLTRQSLPEVSGPPQRYMREVHPQLKRITAFMSVVGAAAALNDLDGDGKSNDVCYVDTRTDQVIVANVPGTGDRYAPFALRQDEPLFNRRTMAPLGVVPVDVNEDGHLDLVVYYAGRTPLVYFHRGLQAGRARLSADDYVVRELVPTNEVWVTGSLTFADLDGDGHLDLAITNYFRDGSDIYNPNGTGNIEMPDSFSRAYNGGGERFYRWTGATSGDNPTVQFVEATDALPKGFPKGWGLAIGACDLDGDLLPEIYVAHDFGPDRLLWNKSTSGDIRFALLEGQKTFTTPASKVLGRDSFKGMGVDFGDLNGDGIPDIFVSNVTEFFSNQESQYAFVSTGQLSRMRDGVAPYVDRSEQLGLSRSGWAWDCKLDDFDNDGVLEAVQATGFMQGTVNRWAEIQELGMANDRLTKLVRAGWPNLLPGDDVSGHNRNPFFARSGKRYVDIGEAIGFGESAPSRGIAVADVDGDGLLDLVVANMWAPSTYYHNECRNCGSFLGLNLRLPLRAGEPATTTLRAGQPKSNTPGRAAIGAAATVYLPDGRRLVGQVDGGNGFSGRRSSELHFGLGTTTGPVRVDIKWRDPSGRPQEQTLNLVPGWHTVELGWTN